jgi:hypothetical protein
MLFESARLSQNRPLAKDVRNCCPRHPVEYTFGFIGQGEHKTISDLVRQNSCEIASEDREFFAFNTSGTPLFLSGITIVKISIMMNRQLLSHSPGYRYLIFIISGFMSLREQKKSVRRPCLRRICAAGRRCGRFNPGCIAPQQRTDR